MVNELLDGAIQGGGHARTDIASWVTQGEGPDLEFKETARFNVRTGEQDRALEAVVVKTVAGFLNGHGGTLVIGVDDAGVAVGLDRDLQTLSRATHDGYEQFLRNLLNPGIGVDLCSRIGIEFPSVDGSDVCALRIPAAPRAVWLTAANDKVFYVRSGNTTQPLNGEEAHRYIAAHWGG
jgi:predicted HTH transcriptional regulator